MKTVGNLRAQSDLDQVEGDMSLLPMEQPSVFMWLEAEQNRNNKKAGTQNVLDSGSFTFGR